MTNKLAGIAEALLRLNQRVWSSPALAFFVWVLPAVVVVRPWDYREGSWKHGLVLIGLAAAIALAVAYRNERDAQKRGAES
ncbi:MAG: hypothetical protein DWQ36_05395 [Acidobacteria bacterium]|nr:MAG: hypothetical protein DWQ30_12885 [Acidobacteriota bacterium]REK10076.1 MAG: hypothetical protein DWQ36_05395 [Acidobacteriota bacterium]